MLSDGFNMYTIEAYPFVLEGLSEQGVDISEVHRFEVNEQKGDVVLVVEEGRYSLLFHPDKVMYGKLPNMNIFIATMYGQYNCSNKRFVEVINANGTKVEVE